jgi:lipopolysaccharide transport system permease protein
MQTFVEAFNGQRSIFDQHLSLLRRMRFPLEAVFLAQVAESSFNLLAKIPVLLLVLIVFGVPLKASLLLGLLACVPVLLAGVALGALLAPLSSLGKDLDRAMVFLPWLVFLLTPVFYRTPVSGPWAMFQAFNPLTAMLDVMRYLSYGGGSPHWPAFWFSLVAVTIGVLAGLVVCKLAPPHLAERLAA